MRNANASRLEHPVASTATRSSTDPLGTAAPRREPFVVTRHRRLHVERVLLLGDLLDSDAVVRLERTLDAVPSAGRRTTIVVDLRGLTAVHVEGLSALVRAEAGWRARGVRVRLRAGKGRDRLEGALTRARIQELTRRQPPGHADIEPASQPGVPDGPPGLLPDPTGRRPLRPPGVHESEGHQEPVAT